MGHAALLCIVFGLLGTCGMARVFGIRFRLAVLPGLGVSSLVVALFAFFTGAVLAPGRFAPWPAMLVGIVMLGLLALVFQRTSWAARVSARLLDPARREVTLARLRTSIERVVASPALTRQRSHDIIGVSSALIFIDQAGLAAAWLGKIDAVSLPNDLLLVAVNNEAVAWMMLGKLDSARAALRKIEHRAPSSEHDTLFATSALIRALEGDHKGALDEADALEARAKSARLDGAILEIRATAYAGLGDLTRAKEMLAGSRDDYRDTLLVAVVRKGGPAATLARQLLEAQGSPYR
ncbi:MAG: hypothetical protein HOW73_39380 [Polyangiaceae bacterium]|nr:hypothetical protein [Polyangiaceae bacterium]